MSGIQITGFVILFSTVGLIFVCVALYARIQMKRHFVCRYCGFRFKPSSLRSFFTSREGVDRMLTCPNCGKSGYFENVKDEEYVAQMQKEQAEAAAHADEQEPQEQPAAQEAPEQEEQGEREA